MLICSRLKCNVVSTVETGQGSVSKSNVRRFILARTPRSAPLRFICLMQFCWELRVDKRERRAREENCYLAINSSPASSNASFLCCFLSKPSCCVIQPAGHSPCLANQSSPLSNGSIPANKKSAQIVEIG